MTAAVRLDADARHMATPLAATQMIVPGMRCAGCIAKLERELPLIRGIASARVHFGARQVAIEHDPAVTVPDLVAALSRLGFDAQPMLVGQAVASDVGPILRALAVAAFAAMNIMLLSVGVWSGAEGATRDMFHWLSAAIAVPAIAYAGQPFFRSAFSVLRHGRTNMDVPISIGLIVTTAMSLFETVTGGAHVWFDGATMLCAFLLGGRVLDAMMRARAREGVTALLSQQPAGANVVGPDGRVHWTAAADLVPGMVMLVAAGERVAADGDVIEGASTVDRSLVTGESAPTSIGVRDRVDAGVLNLSAPVRVTVTATPGDSSLAEIARLMAAAEAGKSQYVRIADRAARLYAPAVHTLAALSFAGWMLAGAGWHQSLLIAVAVLLITCPCALGLAVPVAQVVAAGALMKRGVLVKDGGALERLALVDRALFDKTGTLTRGAVVPDGLESLADGDRSVLLALAQASTHPMARAIAARLGADGVVPAPLSDICEQAGQGMIAHHGTDQVELVRAGDMASTASELRRNGALVARITATDALRADAIDAIARMKAMGIGCSILSGDTVAGVRPVAAATGLWAQAAARPEDKIAAIDRLKAQGASVLMVGDGLNDGPALAAATAAMAPANASDAGRQAADLLFLGEGLGAVPFAVAVARRTRRIVRQNLALAVGYNVLAVPLAIMGMVTPLVAAVAMSGSSLLVIGNALRLARVART